MKRLTIKKLLHSAVIVGVFVIFTSSSYPERVIPGIGFGVKDTIDDDSLKFPFPDYQNDLNGYLYKSPLFLSQPSNIKNTVVYDYRTGKFVFKNQIGDFNYRQPYSVDFDKFMKYQNKKQNTNYWSERLAAETAKGDKKTGLVDGVIGDNLNIAIPGLGNILGSDKITVKPQGNVELIFGVNISNIENPTLPENLQRSVNFDFKPNIKIGLNGMIGEKMRMGINYDTKSTFEFENNIKLAYEGKEDEIIQKIEAGNVSLPLTGTLIPGSHSLFGIKTELKFGHLTITSVLSQQKGEIKTVEVEGGAMKTPYEINADEYESGKHFFLSHYFRDRYNEAMSTLPVIRSNVTITRVEVWVTNRTGKFENARDIIAFTDLGENYDHISSAFIPTTNLYPDNETNNLYAEMNSTYSGVRNINNATNTLSQISEFNAGEDYEKIQNARLLSSSEYTFHPSLGYISLNSSLNNDEILAVAYEYTAGGQTYKVGEFSNEPPTAPDALILKLLKSSILSTDLPLWDLMMKNVYSIDAYQVNKEEFVMEVMYRDDKTGAAINNIPAGQIQGVRLLEVMELDKLNNKNEPGADGYFDFLDKITISAANGRIYFPVLEPFGEHLREKITGGNTDPELNRLAEKYVFQELYDQTQSKARQLAEKNKFFLKGTFKSAGGAEINLNAMNIPEGSVKVTAGGRQLVENQDYTVDYNLGRVTIINHSILESGTPISVSLESNSMFNIGVKSFYGTHLDYRFSDNFNIGATVLHLSRRPLTKKVNIGNEPVSNTMWGLDLNYNEEVPFLTKLVDKIPFVETKEKSTFDITAEVAQLLPGHPKVIGKEGYSHIDDFEATKITLDLKSPAAWTLSGTPQGQTDKFPEADTTNATQIGFNRAKLAWYTVNVDLLRNSSSIPDYITIDDQSDHRVREVYEQELFPYKEPNPGQPPIVTVLNLAYYPNEKGPYNYDSKPVPGISDGVDANGNLNNPASRWAGITRSLNTNDFEEANIEFIEFWMLDPFIYNPNQTGGNLYFNFGNISEDILKDSRQSFENGLSVSSDAETIDTTAWGIVPSLPRITESFDAESKDKQDVGLDGLSDENERTFFDDYLGDIDLLYGPNSSAYINAYNDPSSDNYMFFKSTEYDEQKASILERYKRFNNHQGNSAGSQDGQTITAAQPIPDMEDINYDYTLSESETYFQYKVHLTPDMMQVGKNFITDIREANPELPNKKDETVKWYHFKIPLAEYEKIIGPIQDFKSIRFARIFMDGWDEEVILRFADLYLVKGEWRKYTASMLEGNEGTGGEISDAQFDISAVNIEENASKTPVNYIMPPGVTREIAADAPTIRELNEQSIVLKVNNLSDGDARAAYKNSNLDVRQFKKLQMFIHAEAIGEEMLNDNDVCAFIRLGSDYRENYYEYEIPLKVTEQGIYDKESEADRELVWPNENMLDIEFELLQGVKQRRNIVMRDPESSLQLSAEYSEYIEGKRVSVLGNPNLSNVRTIMIGIRNRDKDKNIIYDDGLQKSVEVWFNELRLSDFNEDGGWAAASRMTTQLADFANVSLAGDISTPGFGSIEKKVSERQQSTDYRYDFSTNVQLGKFFPQKYGVKIPVYVGYSEEFSDPQYNPLDPDIKLKTTLSDPNLSQADKDSIIKMSQRYTKRRSFNVTNINIRGKEKGAKKNNKNQNRNRRIGGNRGGRGNSKPFYHISNWTATYGFNEMFFRDITTEWNIQTLHNGQISYNFNNNPRNVMPFKKVKFLRNKAFKLINDFNFYYAPSMVSFTTQLQRKYNEQKIRNIEAEGAELDTTFNKQFTWSRRYDVRYNLTKSLKFNYTAENSSWIDEPDGRIAGKELLYTTFDSLKTLGRNNEFHQKIQGTWNIPINKLPLLDWTNANANYTADFYWTLGPQTADTINIGNTIRNSQNIQLSGQLNMSRLYGKVKYLKKIDNDLGKSNKNKKKEYKDVKYEQKNVKLVKKRIKFIKHNLNVEKAKLEITDEKNQKISGTTENVDNKTIKFISDTTINNATIVVTGKREKKPNVFKIIADHTLFAMMSLRNVSLTYSENNGTIVPGYERGTRYFGLDEYWEAPGWEFILGNQDQYFGEKAASRRWLTGDSLVNSPLMMNRNVSYNMRATLEPLPELKIDITGNLNKNFSESEQWVNRDGDFVSENRMKQGNFSMSYFMINTTFVGFEDTTYNSQTYNTFLANRLPVAMRLAQSREIPGTGYQAVVDSTGYPVGYSALSQEVLLPAFMAAYSKQSVNTIFLGAFPKIPLPNWRVRYEGLTKIKFLQKFFKKITINHGYNSSYSVSSFQTSPHFNFKEFEDYGYSYAMTDDSLGIFVPEYQIQGVSIDEKFVPLFGIDITLNNSVSSKLEYKQTRNLTLNFTNNQVLEMQNKEYTIGLGYKIPKLRIPLDIGGNQMVFESPLNLRFDLTYRDMLSIVRRIQEDDNQLSAGQTNVSLKFNADYDLTKNFTIRLFYDHTINTPRVSTSYKTSNIKFGFSLKFNLM